MMGEDSIQSPDLTGKRCTKKVTPTEGAISWDTVADAGEVDQDEEDQDNPNRGLANKNVSKYWQLSRQITKCSFYKFILPKLWQKDIFGSIVKCSSSNGFI